MGICLPVEQLQSFQKPLFHGSPLISELHLVLVHYLAVVEFLSSSQERQSCFTQPVVHHPSRAPNIVGDFLLRGCLVLR